MTENTVLIETRDRIAVVTINRPKVLNALNEAVLTELQTCLAKIGADPAIDAVIITGAGDRAFVAGADIAHMQPMTPTEGERWARAGQTVFNAVERLPQPVIAAVNGYALGGGNELAIACDIRIAATTARFGQPEVGIGVTAGFGGTQRLPRLIGAGRARYLLYTGEMIDADTALNWGLIDFIEPPEDLMHRATAVAAAIVRNGSFAVRQTKACCLHGPDGPLDTGLALEARAFGLCFSVDDQKQRMQTFLDRGKK